jgi:aldehyde oxidoreductase
VAVAIEQQMDRMARAIGMDPFEFRLKNAWDVGLPTAADHLMIEGLVSIKETLAAARDKFKERALPANRGSKRVGWGVASAVKNVGFGHAIPESAGAIVELDASGKVTLRHTHHEYGQGSWAMHAQFVSEELGVALEDIEIIGPDTALTPETGASTASRQTFLTGNAVIAASRSLKETVAGHAAEVLETNPTRLEIRGDQVVDPATGRQVPLSRLGERFVVEERYRAPKGHPLLEGEPSKWGQPDFESRWTHWCYAFNTQVAVVEVDVDTGETRVLTIVSANDVGQVKRPQAIEGQIEGGVMQGVGFALSEEFVVEDGHNVTQTLRAYGLPTIDLMPEEIVPVIVEVPHPFGPHGLKGFAEAPSLATAPAILNAIYDATGVRVTSTPATKKRLLSMLSAQQSK